MNYLGLLLLAGFSFIMGWGYGIYDSPSLVDKYLAMEEAKAAQKERPFQDVAELLQGHRWISSVVMADKADINQYYQKNVFKNQIAESGKVERKMISPTFWIEKRECVSSPYMDKPVKARITSHYGRRVHPVSGRKHIHAGIDFRGKRGTPVTAAAGGYVKSVKRKGAYGKTVIVSHGGSYTTLYGHLSSYAIKEGDWITPGQTLGYIGSTGRATGPHLHFEVRCHNVPVNPVQYIGRQNQVAEVRFKRRVKSLRRTASIKKDPNYYTRNMNLMKLRAMEARKNMKRVQ